jgi:hypothetical protein
MHKMYIYFITFVSKWKLDISMADQCPVHETRAIAYETF